MIMKSKKIALVISLALIMSGCAEIKKLIIKNIKLLVSLI